MGKEAAAAGLLSGPGGLVGFLTGFGDLGKSLLYTQRIDKKGM